MLLGTLFVLLSAWAAAAPVVEERQTTCYDGVYIICARGTFEIQGFGLQSAVVDAITTAIPGSGSYAVVYPASLDVNSSIPIGVNDTLAHMTAYYDSCPDSKMVLMGYSQGAQVVGNAIAGGGTETPFGTPSPANAPISQTIGANVIAVVFFGDPQRVEGQGTDNEPDTCTVSSSLARTGANHEAMQFYADRLDEYCNDEDPVCCSSGDDILAHLSYFNTANEDAIASYVSSQYSAS